MKRSIDMSALRGSMTALVTPFRGDEVDWSRFDALVERQIAGGTDWLVACGTTGESPTLDAGETEKLIASAIRVARGRCSVMAGTGSNCTAKTIAATKLAADLGADAALIVAPYYNRPTQEGLFRHYAAVADAVPIPIVLYNVPARTGVSIANDTVVRLRECFPNVMAIKHATGSVDGVTELRSKCDIAVISGDDSITWPLMAIGAVGVISVISNLVPQLLKSLATAAGEGDGRTSAQLHRKVCDLADGLGRLGPNPVPIKTAMAMAGLLAEEFRLPLCPLDDAGRAGVERLLRRHEIAVRDSSGRAVVTQ